MDDTNFIAFEIHPSLSLVDNSLFKIALLSSKNFFVRYVHKIGTYISTRNLGRKKGVYYLGKEKEKIEKKLLTTKREALIDFISFLEEELEGYKNIVIVSNTRDTKGFNFLKRLLIMEGLDNNKIFTNLYFGSVYLIVKRNLRYCTQREPYGCNNSLRKFISTLDTNYNHNVKYEICEYIYRLLVDYKHLLYHKVDLPRF